MKCREAEDLLEAYGASAEAFSLAVDAMAKVLGGSPAEFWSALKIAESAKDDCNEALKAIDLHITKHRCQPKLMAASHAFDFDVPIYNVWKQQEKTAGTASNATGAVSAYR